MVSVLTALCMYACMHASLLSRLFGGFAFPAATAATAVLVVAMREGSAKA